jgi:hypothetical protein
MAAKFKHVKFKKGFFQQVRTLPTVKAEIAKITGDMATSAGEGYVAAPVDVTGGRGRARGAVYTYSARAIADNNKHHTLARVLAEKAI